MAEEDVHQILDDAATPGPASGFGGRVSQKAADVGGFDLEFERDHTASEPIRFE